jgi:hypothetical protein
MLGLRHADLAHQRVRHRNDGHTFGTQRGLGAYQIEEEPFRILEAVRAKREVTIGFDGDPGDVAERPEAKCRNVVRLPPVSGEEQGRGCKQKDQSAQTPTRSAPQGLLVGRLAGEMEHIWTMNLSSCQVQPALRI